MLYIVILKSHGQSSGYGCRQKYMIRIKSKSNHKEGEEFFQKKKKEGEEYIKCKNAFFFFGGKQQCEVEIGIMAK